MAKQCNPNSKHASDPNYICNEKTGRWVLRTGNTGSKLLKTHAIQPSPTLVDKFTDEFSDFTIDDDKPDTSEQLISLVRPELQVEPVSPIKSKSKTKTKTKT